MIPGKLEQEKDDENRIAFQPPNAVTDLHANVVVVFLAIHNRAMVLNLVHAPRRPNVLENGTPRGEAVQQFIIITGASSQRHLGGSSTDISGSVRCVLLRAAPTESPNDRSERVEGCQWVGEVSPGPPLDPGERPGGAARVMHALGEHRLVVRMVQLEWRLHLNTHLISTAIHDSLSARFHSKAVCVCACVGVCAYRYLTRYSNIKFGS